MTRKTLCIIAGILAISLNATCKVPRSKDFKASCDSLSVKLNEHFGVQSSIHIKALRAEGPVYGVYFDKTFSDYPWHPDDYAWFMREFDAEWKAVASGAAHGSLYCNGARFEELLTPQLSRDGKPSSYGLTRKLPETAPLVRHDDRPLFTKGLSGRHIAIWQSHGMYFNEDQSRWMWQRAPLHRTVEDMYTQSYVLDYLIPMLENAGACVMTPRERDTQEMEYICDNDHSFEGERSGTVRRIGLYKESGKWTNAGAGFADLKKVYEVTDNPFTSGSSRKSECSPKANAGARWEADILKRGFYSVYVSYATLPESSPQAHYTVHHLGGKDGFTVNQTMGGGTWVYLGTFEFGAEAVVELDNSGVEGHVVTADAVKIGGGMGKIQREGLLSGKPAYMEGASYWMPWAGADSTMREWDGDYRNDYATRGAWVRMMKDSKGIPFDCSLAFHTDAGTTPNDSIVGTLSIYTLNDEEGRVFSDGSDRMACRLMADWVQTQIADDVREDFNPEWNRRQLWDRNYSESRTTDVPAMLLELLSHQNFADMKYGLDPAFRFTVGRAAYKGILKFLSTLYGTEYAVQPLPVSNVGVQFTCEGNAELSWTPVSDPKEATAEPDEYIIYTRKDDGPFDKGTRTGGTSFEFVLSKGHIYSYKVVAVNKGGVSFPSETVSIGIPETVTGPEVLVVNNFDRVSAPSWTDSPGYAGFTAGLDSGVPYLRDISYIGENYEFRRDKLWETDDDPGFGGCYTEDAGLKPAGNTFDYPYVHGKSLMALGRPFCSMSRAAFVADSTLAREGRTLDLICGKQVTSPTAADSSRFEVFPVNLMSALSRWTAQGCGIFISGSNIATEVWSSVYPLHRSEEKLKRMKDFVSKTLGYRLSSSFGTSKGIIGCCEFYSTLNEDCYCIEAPDGLKPADKNGRIWIRYPASGIPAGVVFQGKGYRVVSMGVPLECIKKEDERTALLSEALSNL